MNQPKTPLGLALRELPLVSKVLAGAAVALFGTWVVLLVLGFTSIANILAAILTVGILACRSLALVTDASGSLSDDIALSKALSSVGLVLLGKSGNLADAKFKIHAVKSIDSTDVLALVAAVLAESQHPIADSIRAAARVAGDNNDRYAAKDFRPIPSIGVAAMVDGKAIAVGGPTLLAARNIDLDLNNLMFANEENTSGRTVIYVLRDTELIGLISLSDSISESAERNLELLKKVNSNIAIVSADAQGVVDWFASELGLNQSFGEITVANQRKLIERLKADGKTIALIGADKDFAADLPVDLALDQNLEGVAASLWRVGAYRGKLTQNLVAAGILAIPASLLAAGVFAPATLALSATVGALLISLSVAIVAINRHLLHKQPR